MGLDLKIRGDLKVLFSDLVPQYCSLFCVMKEKIKKIDEKSFDRMKPFDHMKKECEKSGKKEEKWKSQNLPEGKRKLPDNRSQKSF